MVKEIMSGLMVDLTKENIKWIKKMDMENILGQMEEFIKELGIMENKMEMELI
jgi:hypothetical protein